jgi:anti-anti-sigma regulatory factor
MAANFKILLHHSSESLHLKLVGDFDGTSAYEVINAMLENGGSHRIFIHTANLKEIHPFGKAILEKNLSMFNKQDIEIVFTGEHAAQFTPILNKKWA